MAGDEKSQDFFLCSESRVLVPVGNVGQLIVRRLGFFLLEHAKQAVLAGLGITLGFLSLFHGLVENGHQLDTTAERVHRATLDQRLEYTLVKQAKIDVFAELKDRFEAPKLFSRGDY